MALARRDFLKAVGSAPLIGGLAGVGTSQIAAAVTATDFAFDDANVPMNAANLCPMPVSVANAQARYAQDMEKSLSPQTRRRIEGMKEDARGRLAAMLGTSADEIAIVRNTSEANNVVVQGVPLKQGDTVVLWNQNHPSNSVAWDVQTKREGASVRRFSLADNVGTVDEVVDSFVAAVDNNTRVVSFTHISNITGFRLPVKEICAAIRRRKRDVHIHVDGAQTWGAVDINLGDIDCDSFSGSAHKWFMGPREVGLLYVREAAIDEIWPNVVSVPWGRTEEDPPEGARKFDALGQRDDSAVAALNDALDFHEAMTPEGIESKSMLVANLLREGLGDAGMPFVTSMNPTFASSVIILKAPRENVGDLVGHIYNDAGVITAGVGGLRLSPHVYNNEDHVNRAIEAVVKVRSKFG